MKRLKNGTRTEGEELLTRVLDECLEEDLSFVPHEREIAGKHRFSPEFDEQMETMIKEAEQKTKEKELKKHFHFKWGQMAACIVVFCVCGVLMRTVYLQHQEPDRTESATMMEESTDVSEDEDPMMLESAVEDAVQEEAATAEEAPAEGAKSLDSGNQQATKGKQYCGQTIYPAEYQEMPAALENVTTLVNCPVLEEESPTLTLTIANTGETATSYQMPAILEVWLDDGWYVIPASDAGSVEPVWTRLDEKMAMDEEIDLTKYQIDYGAQKYRLVVRIGEHMLSAEFTFEEVFSEQMETLEEMRKEREE